MFVDNDEYLDNEWTITREFRIVEDVWSNKLVFNISDGSIINSQVCGSSLPKNIRPVFYLNFDVLYASGNGFITNPYRIKAN